MSVETSRKSNAFDDGVEPPEVIRGYLQRVSYPCERQHLCDAVMEQGASEGTMQALERLAERRYQSWLDVYSDLGIEGRKVSRYKAAS